MGDHVLPGVAFNPYADTTILPPFTAIVILLICTFAMLSKRRYAIIAFIIVMNFIPNGVRIYAIGLNFSVLRLLIVVVGMRIILRREATRIRATGLDALVAFYIVAWTLAAFLQRPAVSSLIGILGTDLDRFGAYLVVRALIRDEHDIRTMVRALIVSCFVLVVAIGYEHQTDSNPFHFLGGVPLVSAIRNGRIRAQGPYPHPLVAGALWTAVLPLIIAFARWNGKRNLSAYLAVPAVFLIVYFTGSSTTLIALAVAILGSALYYQRNWVPSLVATAVVGIAAISLWWWHPIWFLYTKIDLISGSTGYFRYLLVNSFVEHWREWFLIGTRNAYSWGANLSLGRLGLSDWVNQFIAEAGNGGIVTLLAFVAVIGKALSYAGHAVRAAGDATERRIRWSIGASILVHVFNFLGMSYYGQVTFSWWMTVAVCASLFEGCTVAQRAPQFAPIASRNLTRFTQ